MSQLVLGVGELGVCRGSGHTIKTFALGSCVSVILLDSTTKTAGMVHIALPESEINPEKAKSMPGYFADTGVEALMEQMAREGVALNRNTLKVKLVGGAQIMDHQGTFNIGKRNVLGVKKILWAKGLAPIAEEVGDTISRTVTVDAESGKVIISTPNLTDRII